MYSREKESVEYNAVTDKSWDLENFSFGAHRQKKESPRQRARGAATVHLYLYDHNVFHFRIEYLNAIVHE